MKKSFAPLILLVPVIFIFYTAVTYHVLKNDAVQYVSLGYNLFHHGVFDDPFGVVPGWIQSPGWPVISGFFTLFLAPEAAAQTASLLVSLALLGLLFFVTKKIFNGNTALLAVMIFALNPQFLISAQNALAEPVYTLLHLALFYQGYQIIIAQKKTGFGTVFGMAVLGAALMMTRTEGFLYIFLLFFLLLYLVRKDEKNKEGPAGSLNDPKTLRRLLKPLLFLSLVFIFILPYGFRIKNKTGNFNVLPKLTFNQRIGKVALQRAKAYDAGLQNPERFQELAWFGLDTTNYTLYAEKILDNQYYKRLIGESQYDKNSMQHLLYITGRNAWESLLILIRSNPFPLLFLVLVLIGLLYCFKNEKGLLFFLILWLLPAGYFILSHVEERFFYVMLPYLSIIAAYGIVQLTKNTGKKDRAVNVILLLLLLNASIHYWDYTEKLEEDQAYYQTAMVLKQTIPEESAVCSKNFSIPFYGNYQFHKMPYCSAAELYKYLQKNQVGYLLLGDEINTVRREFRPIFHGEESGGFNLVKEINTEHKQFKLFRVNLQEQ